MALLERKTFLESLGCPPFSKQALLWRHTKFPICALFYSSTFKWCCKRPMAMKVFLFIFSHIFHYILCVDCGLYAIKYIWLKQLTGLSEAEENWVPNVLTCHCTFCIANQSNKFFLVCDAYLDQVFPVSTFPWGFLNLYHSIFKLAHCKTTTKKPHISSTRSFPIKRQMEFIIFLNLFWTMNNLICFFFKRHRNLFCRLFLVYSSFTIKIFWRAHFLIGTHSWPKYS